MPPLDLGLSCFAGRAKAAGQGHEDRRRGGHLDLGHHLAAAKRDRSDQAATVGPDRLATGHQRCIQPRGQQRPRSHPMDVAAISTARGCSAETTSSKAARKASGNRRPIGDLRPTGCGRLRRAQTISLGLRAQHQRQRLAPGRRGKTPGPGQQLQSHVGQRPALGSPPEQARLGHSFHQSFLDENLSDAGSYLGLRTGNHLGASPRDRRIEPADCNPGLPGFRRDRLLLKLR